MSLLLNVDCHYLVLLVLDVLYHADDAFGFIKTLVSPCLVSDEEKGMAAMCSVLDLLELSISWELRGIPDAIQIIIVKERAITSYTAKYGECVE